MTAKNVYIKWSASSRDHPIRANFSSFFENFGSELPTKKLLAKKFGVKQHTNLGNLETYWPCRTNPSTRSSGELSSSNKALSGVALLLCGSALGLLGLHMCAWLTNQHLCQVCGKLRARYTALQSSRCGLLLTQCCATNHNNRGCGVIQNCPTFEWLCH